MKPTDQDRKVAEEIIQKNWPWSVNMVASRHVDKLVIPIAKALAHQRERDATECLLLHEDDMLLDDAHRSIREHTKKACAAAIRRGK